MSDDLIEVLVDGFNFANYGSYTNTNFAVEGGKIVVRFADDCNLKDANKYLHDMRNKVLSEYFSDNADNPNLNVKEILDYAKEFLNLESFPCSFGKGEWIESEKIAKFPIDDKVIDNFKRLFAHELGVSIKLSMKRDLEERGIEDAKEWLMENLGPEPVDKLSFSDLLCVSFYNVLAQAHFRNKLRLEMEEYGYGKEIEKFWEIPLPALNSEGKPYFPSNKIYFRNISSQDLDFIKGVSEVTKQQIANRFATPSADKKKIKHYKDVLNTLFSITLGKIINGGYREELTDGNFAYVLTIGNDKSYLTDEEAEKINKTFSYLGCGNILTDVKDQINDKSKSDGKIYAITNKSLAHLVPVIVRNALINKDGEFEVDCTLEQERKYVKECKKQQVAPATGEKSLFYRQSPYKKFKRDEEKVSEALQDLSLQSVPAENQAPAAPQGQKRQSTPESKEVPVINTKSGKLEVDSDLVKQKSPTKSQASAVSQGQQQHSPESKKVSITNTNTVSVKEKDSAKPAALQGHLPAPAESQASRNRPASPVSGGRSVSPSTVQQSHFLEAGGVTEGNSDEKQHLNVPAPAKSQAPAAPQGQQQHSPESKKVSAINTNTQVDSNLSQQGEKEKDPVQRTHSDNQQFNGQQHLDVKSNVTSNRLSEKRSASAHAARQSNSSGVTRSNSDNQSFEKRPAQQNNFLEAGGVTKSNSDYLDIPGSKPSLLPDSDSGIGLLGVGNVTPTTSTGDLSSTSASNQSSPSKSVNKAFGSQASDIGTNTEGAVNNNEHSLNSSGRSSANTVKEQPLTSGNNDIAKAASNTKGEKQPPSKIKDPKAEVYDGGQKSPAHSKKKRERDGGSRCSIM